MMKKMKKAKKQNDNQMYQREYWLEMHHKENEKHMKRFLQKFKEIKCYDKSDYSDEAIWYRAALKYHKRAAIEAIQKRMYEKKILTAIFLLR